MLLEGSGLTFQEVGKGTLAIRPVGGSSDRSGPAAGKPAAAAQEQPSTAPSSSKWSRLINGSSVNPWPSTDVSKEGRSPKENKTASRAPAASITACEFPFWSPTRKVV